MEIKTHVTAGCYLTRENKGKTEILLIYKKWSENDQGWVPPKGHIEEGETLEQTALRETTEETGYSNIKIIKHLKTVQIEYPWTDNTLNQKTIHWYHAKLIDETNIDTALVADEVNTQIKMEWFDIDTAKKLMMFDDEKAILDLIAKD